MFTGIIRELGTVAAVSGGEQGLRLEIDAPVAAALAAIGDSVAVNGCCLTVVELSGVRLGFDAVGETLARTTIGTLDPGERVNIEPAIRAGEPLGGHYVQGHVDAVAVTRAVDVQGAGRRLRFEVPVELRRYIVEKGSVTLDGVSLTVAELHPDGFSVALVPHTLAATTFGTLEPGDAVNLEVDVLAKYVEALTPTPAASL
jgi:riboflavin synthase